MKNFLEGIALLTQLRRVTRVNLSGPPLKAPAKPSGLTSAFNEVYDRTLTKLVEVHIYKKPYR